MQTFLPCPGFAASAAVLDNRRLGKQRVEALQVLRAIIRPNYGWRNHPVVRMWRGHEEALGAYAAAICAEWSKRGFADTCCATIRSELTDIRIGTVRSQDELAAHHLLPPWVGDERVHASHRSSLLRKDPDWYRQFLPDARDDLEYYWPVSA